MNVTRVIRDVFACPRVLRDCGLWLSTGSVAVDNPPTPVGIRLFVLLCTQMLSRTLLRLRRYVGDKKGCHGAGLIWAFMRTRTHLMCWTHPVSPPFRGCKAEWPRGERCSGGPSCASMSTWVT